MLMKAILTSLMITTSSSQDIELKQPIEWINTATFGKELTIKSNYSNLSRNNMFILIINYIFSLDGFWKYYKKSCEIEPLEIRIISEKQMNSPKYFSYIDPVMYGRYFPENNHIYITPEAIVKSEYLIHEMTHYLYDVCKMSFKNNKEEHLNINKFIKSLGKL